jgi:hypothetical protein
MGICQATGYQNMGLPYSVENLQEKTWRPVKFRLNQLIERCFTTKNDQHLCFPQSLTHYPSKNVKFVKFLTSHASFVPQFFRKIWLSLAFPTVQESKILTSQRCEDFPARSASQGGTLAVKIHVIRCKDRWSSS